MGSYAAAPALDGWNPEAEAAFLHAAARLPGVSGLEVPFYPTGQLHKYDGDWFLEQVRQLPDHLTFVVTTVPDTMSRQDGSADFGLASLTSAGRQAAVARAAAASEAVRALTAALGRRAVLAVHLFSAPRPVLHGVPAGAAGRWLPRWSSWRGSAGTVHGRCWSIVTRQYMTKLRSRAS
nr:DUF4862 family protein [Pseudarthrobacter sp. C4D7]